MKLEQLKKFYKKIFMIEDSYLDTYSK